MLDDVFEINFVTDFALVDASGDEINTKEEGLLLFGGGTVCDDYFNDNAANAICNELGFGAAARWGSGKNWGTVQSSKPIKLDDCRCTSDGLWSSCSYRTGHNCVHNEDVFLECQSISSFVICDLKMRLYITVSAKF